MQVFYSGQSMQGIIRLAHAEEKIVCSAYIQLNGMVYETKNRMNPNSVNFYDGKIYFINTSNGNVFISRIYSKNVRKHFFFYFGFLIIY